MCMIKEWKEGIKGGERRGVPGVIPPPPPPPPYAGLLNYLPRPIDHHLAYPPSSSLLSLLPLLSFPLFPPLFFPSTGKFPSPMTPLFCKLLNSSCCFFSFFSLFLLSFFFSFFFFSLPLSFSFF